MALAGVSWRLVTTICFVTWIALVDICFSQSDTQQYQTPPVYPVTPSPAAYSHSPPEDDDFDMLGIYGLPGTQQEFRVEVGAGASQCFFQKLRQGAQLHSSFEVMRGADLNINMIIRLEDGTLVQQFEWTKDGNLETVVNQTGIYTFCFDNGLSRFSSKLVYFYLLSYIEADWRKFAEGLQEYRGEIENFTKILEMVDQRANKVLVMQATGRRNVLSDWYMVSGNQKNVDWWSFIMCVLIVCTSAFQVFFVRRLFNLHGTGVRNTSKPRA